ncbi:AfsR/SARP family transcriptional regulator [Amycolatopsis orientalis]|uniref:AfsR/SARP family transcriptional regulator n=1 Tax=Amycolatopsis orientalis TaxID=31958 RepID=UPI0004188CE4|nr:tetratricopeptide repeat protein [Amycolatopsis orientalis]
MRIQLLGPVGFITGDGDLIKPSRSAVTRLLALLAVEAGKPVTGDVLITRIWGDDGTGGSSAAADDESERSPATLRRNLGWLRAEFAAAGGDRNAIRWEQATRSWTLAVSPAVVDYHRFLDEIILARGDADWDRLQHILTTRHERPLSTVNGRWADGIRHTLGLHRQAALKSLFTHLIDTNRCDDLIAMLGPCEDDLVHDENLLLLGAKALAAAGRHAEISAWADRIDARAHDELGAGRSITTHLGLQTLIADPPGPTTHHPAAPEALALPRDITDFTGREPELATLTATVDNAADTGTTTIAIHAIDGMPGIGKTTLGIHAAHRLAHRFPDGQRLLPLHGHTPGQKPTAPFDALHSLLTALGVHGQVLSTHRDVEQRAQLWRSLMASRRMLLILDDPASHDQVEPLLPGTPGSLVIITSRNRLPELDDIHPISLDIVNPDVGATMLLRRAHRNPDTTNAEQVARIVELCGYLPIAIAVAGSQLRTHPAWSVRYLADLLADAYDRLDELQAGERSVRAVFDTSLHDLPTEQRDLFVLLGVHHGPDIDPHATAALTDTTPTQARHLLRALHTRNLVQETGPDRYRLHDLLRLHAHAHADTLNPSHRHHATTRGLDYYLHTTHAATSHLPAYRTPTCLVTPISPHHPRRITGFDDAMAWLTTELPVLAAAIDHTHTTHTTHTTQLSTTLHPYLRTAGQWHYAHTVHHTALTAATRTNDVHAQATALNDLGIVCRLRGDLEAAVEAQTRALQLFTDIGDRRGQGNALNDLGWLYRVRGDLGAAVDAHTRALQLLTDIGDRLGQGNALSELGTVCRLRGDLDAAVEAQTRALQLFTDIGDRRGQGNALNYLGYVYLLRGDLDAAVDAHTRALQLFTDIGSLQGQGNTLNYLGIVYLLRGDLDAAVDAHTRALQLFTDIGDRRGQGNALNDLGTVYRRSGDLEAAVDAHTRALQLLTDIGELLGQANAHLQLGIAYRLTDGHDLVLTVGHLTDALRLFTRVEDTDGQAETHNALGDLTLDHPDAGDPNAHFTTALALARDCGTNLHEANALVGQAQCLHRAGDTSHAITLARQALTMHQKIHAPEAAHTADLIRALESHNQT